MVGSPEVTPINPAKHTGWLIPSLFYMETKHVHHHMVPLLFLGFTDLQCFCEDGVILQIGLQTTIKARNVMMR